MTEAELGKMSVLALAHVGDGVYELMTRSYLARRGFATVQQLHRETVARVNAVAQARAAALIQPELTDAEHAIYRRGRNAHVNSVPKGAELAEYHAATGLEALFGWLWLKDDFARLSRLFELITEDFNAA